MGASQSTTKYENQIGIADSSGITISFDQLEADSSGTGSSDETINYLKSKRAAMDNQVKILESNMKMYMIYDNYDSKNEVIIKDLKKKSQNQANELKQLIQDRDKLKSVLDYDKGKMKRYDKIGNIFKIINLVLFLLIIGLIALIIYRALTHPILYVSDNISLNNIDKMTNQDLEDLSIEDLQKLQGIVNTNFNNKNNKMEVVSESNNISNSNNITKSNLNKKDKFTLSNINSNNNKKK